MARSYEFRDPIHGFIELNPWEREIINQPAFQRLRRIKQLAWTDMVYPGATHTRFEHSLGVMHVATRLFDALRARHEAELKERGYESLDRQRQLVRLAALLHDVGHAPFSHAAEEIMPLRRAGGQPYTHEEYSSAIVEHTLRDVIEGHDFNKRNHALKVQDIKDFFLEAPTPGALLLREIVSGQMDADRMDYMLRDSHHAGVSYGNFDLNRIIATVGFVKRPDSDELSLGIVNDGVHAAEGLLIARFMLFTQVYFHKTRVIYDFHLVEAMKEMLAGYGGSLPAPEDEKSVGEYLKWDDWRVCGELPRLRSDHSNALLNRQHYRLVWETPEIRSIEEIDRIEKIERALSDSGIPVVRRDSEKNWYKFGKPGDEIFVDGAPGARAALPLSVVSSVVRGLQPVYVSRLYVPINQREAAKALLPG